MSFIPCVFWGFYFCRTWHRNTLRSLDQPVFWVVRQEGTQALPWRGSYTNTHVIWTMNKVWQALEVQGSHCLRGMQGSVPEKTSTTHSHPGEAARQSSDATSLVQDIWPTTALGSPLVNVPSPRVALKGSCILKYGSKIHTARHCLVGSQERLLQSARYKNRGCL